MSKVEDYIRRVVDEAPPLSDEQKVTIKAVHRQPRTLADLPVPDEQTARRLVALLWPTGIDPQPQREHFEVSKPEAPVIRP